MLRLAAPLALLLALTPAARADDKKCVLRWYGLSMFQLETSGGKKVVFDPHGVPEFGRNLLQADVVLCSHLHNDHTQLDAIENVKAARVFMGVEPAKKGQAATWKVVNEKVGAIQIRSVGLFHDNEEGLARGKVSAFIVEVDNLKFCHLGDLGHELTPAQLKAIGTVDVLMVPVGGIYTLNGEGAKRVVAQIKPRLFVLPMHYGVPGYDELSPLDEFLDGQANVKKTPETNELVIPVPDAPAAAPAKGAAAPVPTTVVPGYAKK